jgi:UDP-N-acetylglucosamine 1-carboxyvinyltransferase
MQPQICVGLSLATGSSVVTESIFENRFKYVDEILKMGANIRVEGNVAFINGVESLKGASLKAPDLRAGAALVLAGLAANGFSSVSSVEYILRGYERLECKLQELGAAIELVDSDEAAEAFKRAHES